MKSLISRFSPITAIVLFGLFCSFFVVAAEPGKVPAIKAEPADAAPSFWKVQGKHNTVWLFGSIHVLTQAHYPMPANVERAYTNSPNLVVEVDVVNMNPATLQQTIVDTGMFKPGTDLKTFLGERYAKANALAAERGYDLSQMQTMRPWLISLMVTVAEFTKMGLTPDQGVDAYFLKRAAGEQKKVIELETLESQLKIFSDMDRDTEVASLLQTFEQLQSAETQIRELISAWESGKLDELEDALLESFADYPGVYQKLVIDRNRNWLSDLTPILTESKKDHFVVVGALHLVGDQGVVKLLGEQGFKVTRQ